MAIVIDNIAIPEGITAAWDYYINYLRLGGKLSPAAYLMQVHAPLGRTGEERQNALQDWVATRPAFLLEVEIYHAMWEEQHEDRQL